MTTQPNPYSEAKLGLSLAALAQKLPQYKQSYEVFDADDGGYAGPVDRRRNRVPAALPEPTFDPFNMVKILQAARKPPRLAAQAKQAPPTQKEQLKKQYAKIADTPALATGDKGQVQALARKMAADWGWDSPEEWAALMRLVTKESGWNPAAANPTSTARGLFQKMTSIHGPLEKDIAGQIEWGLNYIKGRYGSPSQALAFHNSKNWY